MNTANRKFQEEYHINPQDPKDRVLIYRIDKIKKEIEYFPRFPQNQWVQAIRIEGFHRLPAGFAKNGSGLLPKKAGYLLVKKLSEKLGEFDLVISLTTKTQIKRPGDKYRVAINYLDFRSARDNLADVVNENYDNLLVAADAILNKFFPKYFKQKVEGSRIEYQSNQLEKALRKSKLLENLSKKDIQALVDFFPGFIKYFGKETRGQQKLIGVLKNRNAIQKIYLDELVEKFERKMKLKVQNEHSWQRFFREHFLLFNPNYVYMFEKKNLSLVGKYPDFLPMDIYGHLDIFEIKRPNTKLMEYDESRKNYYWGKELSKAIAQVESYIHSATTYSSHIVQEIKKKEKIDINVVRPRGFVIAGTREQLTDQEKSEYFRLLNDSLKSVRVILYDDVLDNLMAFLMRLGNN